MAELNTQRIAFMIPAAEGNYLHEELQVSIPKRAVKGYPLVVSFSEVTPFQRPYKLSVTLSSKTGYFESFMYDRTQESEAEFEISFTIPDDIPAEEFIVVTVSCDEPENYVNSLSNKSLTLKTLLEAPPTSLNPAEAAPPPSIQFVRDEINCYRGIRGNGQYGFSSQTNVKFEKIGLDAVDKVLYRLEVKMPAHPEWTEIDQSPYSVIQRTAAVTRAHDGRDFTKEDTEGPCIFRARFYLNEVSEDNVLAERVFNYGPLYPTIDLKKGGKGVALGQNCTSEGFTVNMPTRHKKAISFGDTGANGAWINPKTLFDNVPIHFETPHVVDGGRFDPIMAGKDVNGNVWAFGQGAWQEICFCGYSANRTENGFDWKVSINTLTGEISAPRLGLAAYPVGAIYVSWDSTDPGAIFGGSWQRLWGFLRASDNTGTGGDDWRTLSWDNMPRHGHGIGVSVGSAGEHSHEVLAIGLDALDMWRTNVGGGSGWRMPTFGRSQGNPIYAWNNGSHSHGASGWSDEQGNGWSFDNRPYFQNVHAWRRVA